MKTNITRWMNRLFIIHCSLFISMALASCGDDDEDYKFDTPAEQDAQGSYVGQFMRIQNGTTDTLWADGSITLTATDTRNLATVAFASADMAEMDTIAAIPVNVSHANQGFVFYTTATTSALQGRITDDQSVKATFSKAIRKDKPIDRDLIDGGWLRRNAPSEVPVILLGVLGVDSRYQGSGLGRMLLRDASARAVAVAGDIGAKGLVVDPVDEEAAAFYARNGFEWVPGLDRMFVQLKMAGA